MSAADEVRRLYHDLLAAWNRRDAAAMAALFAEDGCSIGFDGSQHGGRAALAADLGQIFQHHKTPPFVSIVREVRAIADDVGVLTGVVSMVPDGKDDIVPALNAIQTLVAVRRDGTWQVAQFQNTPAAYHGRPELVEKLSAELRQAWRQSQA